MDQTFLPFMSKQDFYRDIAEILDEKLAKLTGNTEAKPSISENEFLTRKETCKVLRISLPTLGNYVKQGIIKKYRIGRRVLFKKVEIESLFEVVNSNKYKAKNLSI